VLTVFKSSGKKKRRNKKIAGNYLKNHEFANYYMVRAGQTPGGKFRKYGSLRNIKIAIPVLTGRHAI